MSVLIAEHDLIAHPLLAQQVAQIDRQAPPVGYERLLYRHFFIVPEQNSYTRVILDQKNRLVIPLHLEDAAMQVELSQYCAQHAYRLFVMDGYRDWLVAETKLVPIGVWHNISVTDFNLRGAHMRKLRYLVTKFGKSGHASVVELSAPDAEQIAAMRGLMASWATSKGHVIEHTAVCMRELLQGYIAPAHRVFLTELDGKLCSVIVTARSADGVWIMDQEFYDPHAAPLGHMEYTVVAIIEKLRIEGEQTFSLGLTWHPFAFAHDPRKDLEGWNWLKRFAENGSLLSKVFTQGAANYQFKKKFCPVEQPFYAYFQQGLPFEVLLQFWPVFMFHSLTAERLIQQLSQESSEFTERLPEPLSQAPSAPAEPLIEQLAQTPSVSGGRSHPTQSGPKQAPEAERVAMLRAAGSLRAVAYQHNPLDLQTDSWWGLRSPAVREQLAWLQARSPEQTLQSAKAFRQLIPFKHVILTPRGRDAEGIFYRAWLGSRKLILSTLSWTTTLAYQLGNGFQVQELPHPSLRSSVDPKAFAGEFDLDGLDQALQSQLSETQSDIALVALELLNNAAGGAPVRLSHLQQLRERLAPLQIPLVLDATRVVRNALLIQEHEHLDAQYSVWELVTRTLSMGDHVVASLCKDFGVTQGGMIATNDAALAESVRAVLAQGDWGGAGATPPEDPRWEAVLFPDLPRAEAMLHRQHTFMQRLKTRLGQTGLQFAQVGPG